MFYENEKQAENKLSVLYLLNIGKKPVYQQHLSDLLIAGHVMDYFTVQQTIGQLKKSSFIKETGSPSGAIRITIEPSGVQTLEYFQNRLSAGKIQTLERMYEKNMLLLLKNTRIQGTHEQTSDGCWKVSLSYRQEEGEDLYLTLTLNSEEDAKKVIDDWENNCNEMFTRLKQELLHRNSGEVRE